MFTGMKNNIPTRADIVNSTPIRLQHVMNHIVETVIPSGFQPGVEGYIYLIRCGRYFKIGVADNPAQRLTMLQIGNPHRLVLVKYWPSINATDEERRIHALLARYHVRGEWFKLPRSVVSAL